MRDFPGRLRDSAPSVTTVEMVETLAARTAAACAGHRIIVAQDTTEINFAGREERRRGLGPAGGGHARMTLWRRAPGAGHAYRIPMRRPFGTNRIPIRRSPSLGPVDQQLGRYPDFGVIV